MKNRVRHCIAVNQIGIGFSDMGIIATSMREVSGINLSSIFESPIFSSCSSFESQHRLSKELVEHETHWGSGCVDTALYRSEIGRCEILALRYGAEVEVRPQPFEDFVLIQMPIRGHATLKSSGMTHHVTPGKAAIFSPGEESSVLWSQDCEQLILKLPKTLLDWGVEQLQVDGSEHYILPEVESFDSSMAKRWFRLVAELLDCKSSPQGSSLRWLRQVEESLTLFLLSNKVHGANLEKSALPQQVNKYSLRLEECIRARLSQETTLSELAVDVGVSVRSLHSLCQRDYGQSPMELLRNFRLEAARARFLQSNYLSVTEVALECGFSHVGRFASYYRQRFGELPRITARR